MSGGHGSESMYQHIIDCGLSANKNPEESAISHKTPSKKNPLRLFNVRHLCGFDVEINGCFPLLCVFSTSFGTDCSIFSTNCGGPPHGHQLWRGRSPAWSISCSWLQKQYISWNNQSPDSGNIINHNGNIFDGFGYIAQQNYFIFIVDQQKLPSPKDFAKTQHCNHPQRHFGKGRRGGRPPIHLSILRIGHPHKPWDQWWGFLNERVLNPQKKDESRCNSNGGGVNTRRQKTSNTPKKWWRSTWWNTSQWRNRIHVEGYLWLHEAPGVPVVPMGRY